MRIANDYLVISLSHNVKEMLTRDKKDSILIRLSGFEMSDTR